jgi:hypothetical protein
LGGAALAIKTGADFAIGPIVAANQDPDEVRDQFKAWCTRRLKTLERERQGRRRLGDQDEDRDRDARSSLQAVRTKWWTERGSGYFVNDDEGLDAVIQYVCEGQERRGQEP